MCVFKLGFSFVSVVFLLLYSGIGYETAKDLVIRGCNVIITCRSQSKINKTIESIQSEIKTATLSPSLNHC